MDHVEQMRGRDITHVERRVLAHQDGILRGKVDAFFGTKLKMCALLVLHLNIMAFGGKCAIHIGQSFSLIIKQLVAAGLGLQH